MVRLFAFLGAVVVSVCASQLVAQEAPGLSSWREAADAASPVIEQIAFDGLRRISPLALRPHIGSREGEPFSETKVAADVRALARLGWFHEIQVEILDRGLAGQGAMHGVRLLYHMEENPFLTHIDFCGSRLLSRKQIEQLLQDRQLVPLSGEPANDLVLYRAALAIRGALEELGHSQSRVRIERQTSANSTLQVKFVIDDGPNLTVGKVRFDGNPVLPEKTLRAQMNEIKPQEWFSGLRGKNIFTQQGFEKDRVHLLRYYQNQGYPDARVGLADAATESQTLRRWLPWPRRVQTLQEGVRVPVDAGVFYRMASVEVDEQLINRSRKRRLAPALLGQELVGKPYSAAAVENLRRAWFATVNPKPGRGGLTEYHGVDATRTFDPATGRATVRLEAGREPPVTVERIEFEGLQRFSDRYVRRRVGVEEGSALDERALEAGLTRLSRTGYFRPLKRDDVRAQVDEETRTARIKIQLHEIGQQRASLTGGQSTLGNTLGVVYSVFDLLNREELLSAQIEGGPEAAWLVLGLAKEGFLGSHGSLAISLFDSVLRPRLGGAVKGPFYTSQSRGVNAATSYTVSASDSFGVNYAITQNITQYSPSIPQSAGGAASNKEEAKTDSRSVGLGWTHASGAQRGIIDGSISGGWLGGNENLLRSSAEYSRIVRDPIFSPKNAWAFRLYARGVGSYAGNMPLYARLLSGNDLVRGLKPGELGPYEVSSTIDPTGAVKYTASPAGSNVVTAASAEYRVPLRAGVQASAFFDVGTGLLLPNWLGASRPTLFGATNGIVHGSSGIELSWTVPGVQLPVRANYSLNVLRLNRFLTLPNGTVFHAHNKLAVFGWALGSMF